MHGLKPPVAGKRARRPAGGRPTAAAIAKDFVCHHVLAKGPSAAAAGEAPPAAAAERRGRRPACAPCSRALPS